MFLSLYLSFLRCLLLNLTPQIRVLAAVSNVFPLYLRVRTLTEILVQLGMVVLDVVVHRVVVQAPHLHHTVAVWLRLFAVNFNYVRCQRVVEAQIQAYATLLTMRALVIHNADQIVGVVEAHQIIVHPIAMIALVITFAQLQPQRLHALHARVITLRIVQEVISGRHMLMGLAEQLTILSKYVLQDVLQILQHPPTVQEPQSQPHHRVQLQHRAQLQHRLLHPQEEIFVLA